MNEYTWPPKGYGGSAWQAAGSQQTGSAWGYPVEPAMPQPTAANVYGDYFPGYQLAQHAEADWAPPPLPSEPPPLPPDEAGPPPLPQDDSPPALPEGPPPLPSEPPEQPGHIPSNGWSQVSPHQHTAAPWENSLAHRGEGPYAPAAEASTRAPWLAHNGGPGVGGPMSAPPPDLWQTQGQPPSPLQQPHLLPHQPEISQHGIGLGHTPAAQPRPPLPGYQQPQAAFPPAQPGYPPGQQDYGQGQSGYQQWAGQQAYAGYPGQYTPGFGTMDGSQQFQQLSGSYQAYQRPYAGAYPGYSQPAYPGPQAYAQGGYQQVPWQQPAPPRIPASPPPAASPPVMRPNIVDAQDLLLPPGRERRPRKIAIIMRGLPGSGKSHIAKKLREVEVENGGSAPRIHSIDDYFVTEVEREVEEEQPGRKAKKRKVVAMEYCYEAELEGAYSKSLLKAFSKTVEDGSYAFVIVDAPNMRVEDVKGYFSKGQSAGFEVYVLKPLEHDPEVCFKRNVHQRQKDDIDRLAQQWEEPPTLYTQLDVTCLFEERKDAGPSVGINEVEMEDGSDAEATEYGNAAASITSRWSALDDEPQEQEAPRRKKRKEAAAEADRELTGKKAQTQVVASQHRQAGGLARGPPATRKSVRWADQVTAPGGFSMGGSATQQLETIHVLEGLGPQDKAGNHQGVSFADQVKADHKGEQSFRDILFGGRRA